MRNNIRENLKDIFYAGLDAVNPYNVVTLQGKFLKNDSYLKGHAKILCCQLWKSRLRNVQSTGRHTGSINN